MANNLVKSDKSVEFESNGEIVKLSPSIIRNYLVNGNGHVNDEEVVMFLNLCRFQHLNPFLREAYLIKYGSQPATIVTGKDVFTKRARRQKDFAGMKAGIVVEDPNGNIIEREGTIIKKDEILLGGFCEVYVKGYSVPIKATCAFDEFAQTTKDGKLNTQWRTKGKLMIRKCAVVSALREAFPEEFGGLYSPEEMPVREELPTEPIEIRTETAEFKFPDFDAPETVEVVEAEVEEEIPEAAEAPETAPEPPKAKKTGKTSAAAILFG